MKRIYGVKGPKLFTLGTTRIGSNLKEALKEQDPTEDMEKQVEKIVKKSKIRSVSIIDYYAFAGRPTTENIKTEFAKFGVSVTKITALKSEHQRVRGVAPLDLINKRVLGKAYPVSHKPENLDKDFWTFDTNIQKARIGFFKEMLTTFGRVYYLIEVDK